ncbi:HdaA/DnaA family protein [Candidatus Bealeia paramacronuclearis]|uniref:HdaA/DnaA family protein n=1 Tax=Candidatus Bealeia paramacronuclearis TaxID=1921001 RepID=UPI003BB10FBB
MSSSNEEALSWLGKWPEWPSRTLLIYGSQGSGKSHLASIWKSNARLLRPEEITVETLEVILTKSQNHFILDNAEYVKDEEALFHFLNATRQGDGSLLLLSQTPPREWGLTLPDLQSRLNALIAVGIQEPDDHLMRGLIKKYALDQQIPLSVDVLNYLFHHLPRSYQGLWASLEYINAEALRKKRGITIPLVREALLEHTLII